MSLVWAKTGSTLLRLIRIMALPVSVARRAFIALDQVAGLVLGGLAVFTGAAAAGVLGHGDEQLRCVRDGSIDIAGPPVPGRGDQGLDILGDPGRGEVFHPHLTERVPGGRDPMSD